jgi:hypothetical protein
MRITEEELQIIYSAINIGTASFLSDEKINNISQEEFNYRLDGTAYGESTKQFLTTLIRARDVVENKLDEEMRIPKIEVESRFDLLDL